MKKLLFTILLSMLIIGCLPKPKVSTDLYDVRKIHILSEQKQLILIRNKPESIQYIQNPSEAVQLAAVNTDGNTVQYISNPSEKVQLAAIKQNAYAFRYIKSPSESIKLASLKKAPLTLGYFDKVTTEYLRAIRWNRVMLSPPNNFKYENKDLEISITSLMNHGSYFHIKNKTNKFLKVLRISFYDWDDEVSKGNSRTISPHSSSKFKYWSEEYKTYSLSSDKVRFGLALEYSLGEFDYTNNVYFVNEYSVFNLYNHELTSRWYLRQINRWILK